MVERKNGASEPNIQEPSSRASSLWPLKYRGNVVGTRSQGLHVMSKIFPCFIMIAAQANIDGRTEEGLIWPKSKTKLSINKFCDINWVILTQ